LIRTSDVYALSATFYLLISGHMPFRENYEFEWIIAVAENMVRTVCPLVSTGNEGVDTAIRT
jgi:hypothetical protein